MLTITVEGVPQVLQALSRLATAGPPTLVSAVQAEAERILEASFPLVPVDTGLLLATGMVEPQPTGADIRYGGHGLAPYALVVHEDVTMNHPNGGQAKYLQDPLVAALDGMAARLGTQVSSALRP